MTSENKVLVLVVDDIPLMRTMLVKFVHALGRKAFADSPEEPSIETVEAANGRAAIDVVRSRPVQLIFLDIMMPEMDGLTFLSLKKDDPSCCDVPVIVCSAVGESDTISRAKELGAFAYITKPFTLKSVEESFSSALSTVLDATT